jgi:hypothetical protein
MYLLYQPYFFSSERNDADSKIATFSICSFTAVSNPGLQKASGELTAKLTAKLRLLEASGPFYSLPRFINPLIRTPEKEEAI